MVEPDTSARTRTACLVTNGCPENRIDAARMLDLFKANGWHTVDDYREADCVIFNACGLTQSSEDLSVRIYEYLKATKRPSAELIVCGCLPRINPARLSEVYRGPTFGSDELGPLAEMLRSRVDPDDIHTNRLAPMSNSARLNNVPFGRFEGLLRVSRFKQVLKNMYRRVRKKGINVGDGETFYIKASTGCLNECAYCAVKLSRGNLRSRPVDDVVAEFDDGLARGFSNFALIGTDLGSYGRDIGVTLTDLLEPLVARDGARHINLRNLHPRFLIEMAPDLCEILKLGKISFIASAAQSGSNRILERMSRGYRIEDIRAAVEQLRATSPDTAIRSQFIVGFPGETEDDFQATLRCVEDFKFDYVEPYKFQSRPGTKAAEMPDQIPRRTVKTRYLRLLAKTICHNKRICR